MHLGIATLDRIPILSRSIFARVQNELLHFQSLSFADLPPDIPVVCNPILSNQVFSARMPILTTFLPINRVGQSGKRR